VKLLIINS